MRKKVSAKSLFFFLISAVMLFICCDAEAYPLCFQNEVSAQIKSTEDHIFGQHIRFDSKILEEEKNIFIYLPESYAEGSAHYPVMYVLDGGSYFEPFAGMAKYLSLYEMIPEMIVVAIASGDRLKEFTYTKANEETGNWPTSGGAESFHQFLSDELIPFIESNYRTHSFRILVGHSLAGFFAVETLSRNPDIFQATIALSPSLYWNQFEWLKNAEIFLNRHDSLKHFLFISGEKKDKEQTNFLDKFKNLTEAKAPKDFVYEYRCLPDEDHGSVAFPGLFMNLKHLFQGWRFPVEAWEAGPEKVKKHFQALSERYGFPVPISEEFLNGHALHGLRRHEAPDEAIQLFELCLTLYPNSAEAYEGLGEAYEAKGMKERAAEYYQRAQALKAAETKLKEVKKKKESPLNLDEYDFVARGNMSRDRGTNPKQIARMDNNGEILLACLEAKKIEQLKAHGIKFLQSQLNLLVDWDLLEFNSKNKTYKTMIHVYGTENAVAIRQLVGTAVEQLAKNLSTDIELLKSHLKKINREKSLFSILYAQTLHDYSMKQFGEEIYRKPQLSAEHPFWNGYAWAIYPVKKFNIGVTVLPVEGNQFFAVSAATAPRPGFQQFFPFVKDAVDSKIDDPILKKAFSNLGIFDEQGNLTIPIFEGEWPAKLENMAKKVYAKTIELVDSTEMKKILGMETQTQAAMFIHYEIRHAFLSLLLEKGIIELPVDLDNADNNSPEDVGNLLFLIKSYFRD